MITKGKGENTRRTTWRLRTTSSGRREENETHDIQECTEVSQHTKRIKVIREQKRQMDVVAQLREKEKTGEQWRGRKILCPRWFRGG